MGSKCHSSQHPRQGGGKLGCQGRDIAYSMGQVGWDNRNIHSDYHSDIVCGPKASPELLSWFFEMYCYWVGQKVHFP